MRAYYHTITEYNNIVLKTKFLTRFENIFIIIGAAIKHTLAKLSEQSLIYSAKEAVKILEGNELVIDSALPLIGNRKRVATFPQIRKRHFQVCTLFNK